MPFSALPRVPKESCLLLWNVLSRSNISGLKDGDVGETILRWTRARDVPREFLGFEEY